MYLKKIEIQGFKSFANKVVLEFKPGISGIVGPNGSGKSNVADAVRWVLGEQSAKSLRGSNMQDVIFAGTEVRKPQGYAYVTLVLDNSDKMLSPDYDEISVTRKTFRSGESEFRINGNQCRLKDIHELFYDTGAGREGYSIIGQGQVERILNAKPDERRELFDEAAGIVKQRKRKDAALKKLEDEQNSIVRVKDIIDEIERRLGPLKRQSETAKKYLNLRDELKTYEVGAFFKESEDLEKKVIAIDKRIEILTGDLEETRKTLEKQRSDYDEVSAERERLEKIIEENREDLNDQSVKKQSLEGQIALLDEQIGALKKGVNDTRARIITLEEQSRERLEEKQTLLSEKGKLNITIDDLDDKIVGAQEQAEELDDKIRIAKHRLEQTQGELLSNTSQREKLAADEQRIRTEIEQAKERLSGLHEGRSRYEGQIAAAEDECGKSTAQLRELDEKIKASETELAVKKEEQAKCETAKNTLQKRFSETYSGYQGAKSKLETLSALAERYDGYGESIKRVMDRRGEEKGIRGVVADIIKVEEKFETAIETALGGRIQNIVVDTEATAKKMINYLKTTRCGRATFLPMNAVDGSGVKINTAALKEHGSIGFASELVDSEDSYRGLIEFLLGRILVVDNMDNAVAIAGRYNHSLNIVTLDGEHLTPGGAMTGGAFRNKTNLLGRGRQISELEKKVKQLADEGQRAQKELAENDARATELKRETDRLSNELYMLRISRTELTAKVDQLNAEITRGRNALAESDAAAGAVLKEIEKLEKRGEQASKEAEDARAQDEARKNENESDQALIEELQTKLDENDRNISDMKLEYSRLTERDSHLMQDIRRLTAEAAKLQEEKNELISRGDPEEAQISEKLSMLDAAKDALEEAKESVRQLDQKLKGSITRRDNFNRRQKEIFDESEGSNERVAILEKDLVRAHSQKERHQETFDSLVKNIWDEYGLTPEEAEKMQFDGEISLAELRRRIKQKREEIRELGPVNVNSIDEEREQSERCDFLTGQYEDLLKARDSLLSIIEELDEGMKKQFESSFKRIREEFGRVFRELFGGGMADLQIVKESDEDLLDSGVSVIAQPPGKKLQNMLQLSGGEKSLTAIALIFAIQNLKPSPFCLVDEIEAALDETNVDRFAAYLKKLQDSTQILAITHRRGTMQVAQMLYGITMQEKGVSTLVSVDLSDPEYK